MKQGRKEREWNKVDKQRGEKKAWPEGWKVDRQTVEKVARYSNGARENGRKYEERGDVKNDNINVKCKHMTSRYVRCKYCKEKIFVIGSSSVSCFPMPVYVIVQT
jgi:hypothetical protein